MKPINHPIILAIDTSGPTLNLCLKADGKNHVYCQDMPRGHAEILFDKITELLQQNYSKFSQITRIAVTVGPGSFTGLRIGIAAARGLGLALNIKVVGIPNLYLLSLAQKQGPFYIILDARRDQFYAQRFIDPGVVDGKGQLLESEQVELLKSDSANKIYSAPEIDIALLANFATNADMKKFPPFPAYIRPADAKPQKKLPLWGSK